MSLELHEGDIVHSDRYHCDMTVVHVADETNSGIGTVVYSLTDADGWAYDLIEGVCCRVGCA